MSKDILELIKESYETLDESIEYRDLITEETKFIKRGDQFFDTEGNLLDESDQVVLKHRIKMGFYIPKVSDNL